MATADESKRRVKNTADIFESKYNNEGYSAIVVAQFIVIFFGKKHAEKQNVPLLQLPHADYAVVDQLLEKCWVSFADHTPKKQKEHLWNCKAVN